MPQYRVIYEDTAPFFTYSGEWGAGSSSDSAAERYSESSFMVTQAQDASFSFVFYGTEVSIYGAKRGNHGQYQVSLDGVTSPLLQGAGSRDEFNATLYTGTAGKGLHNVTLVNKENRFLDVDTVSWMASVGNDDEELIVHTLQDSHPNFKYSPSDAWTTSPPNVGTFSGASGHGTSTTGATAQITFEGDAIALYGPAGPAGPAWYSVQVNGQSPALFSGTKRFHRPRQLLYYGANLGKGTHTLTVKLDSVSDRSQVLAVDYVEIYTAPSLGGSLDGSSSSTPIGLIIAIAVCGFIALLALGLLAYIYFLYKKKRLEFTKLKNTAEYPDMQAFQGSAVGYQPTTTSPMSHYPQSAADYVPSTMQPLYSSIPPPTIATAGNAPSVGYYQPSQSATDGGSMVTASGTSSTNPSRTTALGPSRSVRKNRLEPQNEAPSASVPPPAYMDS